MPCVSNVLDELRSRQYCGYDDTLREILQQPATWLGTAERVAEIAPKLREWIAPCRALVFTGSGSSEYAGECAVMALQTDLGMPVVSLAAAHIVVHGARALPPLRPLTLVSLARSGNSPESCAAVDRLIETEPGIQHLVITCNAAGKLATAYTGDARVRVLLLDDATNDRSLVMTSSFTNLALAARLLGTDSSDTVAKWSRSAARLFGEFVSPLEAAGREPFTRAVFLASGDNRGAAREGALKMLEMSAGRVSTMAETYLGLRHGPMSWLDVDTLVVALRSADRIARAYEDDLLAELASKALGRRVLTIGPGAEIECGDAPILHAVALQLLAFFRCLSLGLQPDSPSPAGVITRVVTPFRLHR